MRSLVGVRKEAEEGGWITSPRVTCEQRLRFETKVPT